MMAPDRIEVELRKMQRILLWYVGASLTMLVLIVGGWGRAEVRINNAMKQSDYVRDHALNKDAFFNLVDTYQANIESITKLINDEETRLVVKEFNAKTDAIINRIMAAQTEIVPRGAKK
jgi:hypothetical protein